MRRHGIKLSLAALGQSSLLAWLLSRTDLQADAEVRSALLQGVL
jgi:hypothetical protein